MRTIPPLFFQEPQQMCLALLVNTNMCLRQQQLESRYKPLRYVTWLAQSSDIVKVKP